MFDIVLSNVCNMWSLIFKYILFLFAILFRFLCKYRCIQIQKIKLLELSRHYVVERYIQLCPGAFCYKIQGRILYLLQKLSQGPLQVWLGACPCALPSARLGISMSQLLESHYWPPRGTAGLAQSPHLIKSIYWLRAALSESREHLALGQAGADHPIGMPR